MRARKRSCRRPFSCNLPHMHRARASACTHAHARPLATSHTCDARMRTHSRTRAISCNYPDSKPAHAQGGARTRTPANTRPLAAPTQATRESTHAPMQTRFLFTSHTCTARACTCAFSCNLQHTHSADDMHMHSCVILQSPTHAPRAHACTHAHARSVAASTHATLARGHTFLHTHVLLQPPKHARRARNLHESCSLSHM